MTVLDGTSQFHPQPFSPRRKPAGIHAIRDGVDRAAGLVVVCLERIEANTFFPMKTSYSSTTIKIRSIRENGSKNKEINFVQVWYG